MPVEPMPPMRERGCSRLGKACLDRAPAAHRLPQLCRPVAERRPRSRRAHRRQRLRQDQPARGPLAADLGPGAAPRALSGAGAHGARRAGRWRPASSRRSDPSISAPASAPDADAAAARGRIVRIDGETQSGSGALAEHVEMVWLTPAMDGLFTGPASDRRRFLDRLISGLDPSYRPLLGQFERAMQQRNRLLADDVRDGARFEGFERIMAEAGVAVAAARATAVAELVGRDRRAPRRRRTARSSRGPSLPSSARSRRGSPRGAAIDVEDDYVAQLGRERERDRAAGRTLEGPHRSDLDGRARPQGDAGQGVLDGRAEGAADRPGAGPLRPRRPAPRRRSRRSCCSTRSPPISTRCGGPRCSRKSSLWAARPGCPAPIRRPSRRSGIGPNFTASRRAAIAPCPMRPRRPGRP